MAEGNRLTCLLCACPCLSTDVCPTMYHRPRRAVQPRRPVGAASERDVPNRATHRVSGTPIRSPVLPSLAPLLPSPPVVPVYQHAQDGTRGRVVPGGGQQGRVDLHLHHHRPGHPPVPRPQAHDRHRCGGGPAPRHRIQGYARLFFHPVEAGVWRAQFSRRTRGGLLPVTLRQSPFASRR